MKYQRILIRFLILAILVSSCNYFKLKTNTFRPFRFEDKILCIGYHLVNLKDNKYLFCISFKNLKNNLNENLKCKIQFYQFNKDIDVRYIHNIKKGKSIYFAKMNSKEWFKNKIYTFCKEISLPISESYVVRIGLIDGDNKLIKIYDKVTSAFLGKKINIKTPKI